MSLNDFHKVHQPTFDEEEEFNQQQHEYPQEEIDISLINAEEQAKILQELQSSSNNPQPIAQQQEQSSVMLLRNIIH